MDRKPFTILMIDFQHNSHTILSTVPQLEQSAGGKKRIEGYLKT